MLFCLLGVSTTALAATTSGSSKNGFIVVPKSYSNPSRGTMKLSYKIIAQDQRSTEKTLIMIPGGPGNNADYLETPAAINMLKTRFQIILINPRGSFKSPFLPTEYSDAEINQVKNMALDIEQLRLKLAVHSKTYVYGHSFGGLVGLVHAGLFPDSTSGLISHSSLANFKFYEYFVNNQHDFAKSNLAQNLFRILSLTGHTNLYAEYVSLIEQIEMKASRGEIKINTKTAPRVLTASEFRGQARSILQFPFEYSLKLLHSFADGTQEAQVFLDVNQSWDEKNFNYKTLLFLYCSEFLTDTQLSFKMVKSDHNIRDYYCDGKKVNRPEPLNFEKLIANINIPVLYMHGDYDLVAPAAITHKDFLKIKNLNDARLEKSGHQGLQNEPEQVAKYILNFSN
ncbi:MAG: alpha/beta hydrolase [Bdellovibrionaceae bacterium]|nr:alpha/beta hydrolase [Bdellovibrio sp.]